MKITLFTFIFLTCFLSVQAQMWSPEVQDTLYGNEWIDFDHADRYYKIEVAEDGMYRIPKDLLPAAAENVPGSNFRIFHLGQEVSFYASNGGQLDNSDYLEFYGKKNRSELDEYLMPEGENLLNPEYSFFTDTASYYLSWADSPSERLISDIDNDLSNLPEAEAYFTHQEIQYETTDHNKRKLKAGNVSLSKSFFDDGEGFGKSMSSAAPLTKTFALEGLNSSGMTPELRVRYAGANNVNHSQEFSWNGEVIHSETLINYEFKETVLELLDAEENSEFLITALPASSAANILTIGTMTVTYSRNFNFGGEGYFSFEVPASGGSKYLEINNVPAGGTPVLYDLTNQLRIPVTVENGVGRIALPASDVNRRLVYQNGNAGVNTVSGLSQTGFIDYSNSDAEFIIVSDPRLYFDQNGNNRVQEYADYRSQEYTTLIVSINQLYEQFAYGVARNPISIRNFAHFLKENTNTVKYFFLIGNGREYNETRTAEDLSGAAMYIPTYGVPGADNLLLGKVDLAAPIYPIGRITAQDAETVKVYLDKVIETEDNYANPQTIADRLWMKNILHLGGGGDDFEQTTIKNSLEIMANTLENSMYGAIPYGFYKTSTDVVEEAPSTAISRVINEEGVSILNFFGHSSPTTFDFPIQNPEDYTNNRKYFLMISNGCFSGRCHRDINGIGEDFLFEPGKGAVAYFASNGYGYISALNTFTRGFYNKLGNDMYGEGLGDIFHAQVLEAAGPPEQGYTGTNLLSQQNTLQADPALKLYPHDGPDLTFDESSVRVNPDLINTQLSDFQFDLDLLNIGKYTVDTVDVAIKMNYPSGETYYNDTVRVAVPPARRTISFNIPIDAGDQNLVGLNTIYLEADADDEYEELPSSAEFNNKFVRSSGQEGYEILIVSNDVVPIFPKEYSITNQTDLELIASTVDVFAEQQNFYIQIDTTLNFNSPLFKEKVINQNGGLLKWKPEISFENDVVYYWRTSPQPEEDNFRWNTSSFLYLEGVEDGWNQSHFYQYKDNEFNFMELPETRRFKFVQDFKEIIVENGVQYFEDDDVFRPCVLINGSPQHCGTQHFTINQGIKVWVLDSITLEPKLNYNSLIGSAPRKFFGFETNTFEGREAAVNFLRDSIEIGNYVAFATIQRTETHDYMPEEWALDSVALGDNIFSLLEAEGADLVRQLETLGSRPYSFFFKKGYPDETGGESTLEPGEIIESTYSASALYDEGSFVSVPIGPAAMWNTLEWSNAEVPEEYEISKLNIYGLRSDGSRDFLLTDVTDSEVDLSLIDANEYPQLQLEWFSRDSVLRTSPQLNNWRVLYRGLPEAALNPQIAFEMSQDTVQQGQNVNLQIGVENIGLYPMDSVLVDFRVKDAENSSREYAKRFAPLDAGETLVADVNIDTKELSMLSNVLIDMNPDEDQPEETHINNTGILNFFVQPDERNPILDVTFDGVHILNGDIISPTPQIVMSFSDENEFLAMSDTSQFRLSVDFPDRSSRRVYFSDPQIVFIPADPSNLDKENKAVIEYAPEFEQDGTYTLRVEGQDASGNASGDLQYTIEFEIITKSMISNVLNYPNPFSNATRFVYTLTGNESPAFFKIQIMTVSGRIVREITQTELGEMKIGTHQTDFVWDGTDEYGDKLANGVYLYRVVAKNAAGEDIEQYETDADRFFNKGFGKMVIVR